MMIFKRNKLVAALRFSIAVLAVPFLLRVGYSRRVNAGDRASDAAPTVTITAPKNDSTYAWNSLVNYNVVVSYQGKSAQYQEIPSNQVLLVARYVPDVSTQVSKPPSATGHTPAGLLDIMRSNCIGCHEFNAKAMGPSFAAIAERYPQNQATLDRLSRYIHDGSKGVWGAAPMPPHQELSDDQLHAIAAWIMKDAANPNVQYHVGTAGAIRMRAPGTPDAKAGMILTASYTSPVAGVSAEQAPYGEDSVIVHGH